MSIQIFGLSVSRGVAIGRAVRLGSARLEAEHGLIRPGEADQELRRLSRARKALTQELETIQSDLPEDTPLELAALLDVHLLLLRDEMLTEAVKSWIYEKNYNAEWALSAQLDVLMRQFDEIEDPYLRERKVDLEQVAERLVRHLRAGRVADKNSPQPLNPLNLESVVQAQGGDLILVAHDIGPADMLQFRNGVFKGFVTDVGGKTSHTAIVARSMDIPAVVGAHEASGLIRSDDWLVIDGDAGVVIVNPSQIVLEEYRYRQQHSKLDRDRLLRLRGTPAQTFDGETIELCANIEMPSDAQAALAAGAQGIGLFRSEFLFMQHDDDELPSEDEQFEAYRAVLTAMGSKPVTIRTIDIGADKNLDRGHAESRIDRGLNPALGLRAIRWSLAEPAMFITQLRALLRASVYGQLKVLIPMVISVTEAKDVRRLFAQAQDSLRQEGIAFAEHVPLGIMVEVPAAVLALDLLLPYADFVSIGTNDLIQYTLAVDRVDEQVSHLYDPWHPAVLQLLLLTVQAGLRAGKSVSVCGELAGDPQFTDILLALGVRQFSMHPSRMLQVKQLILRADCQKLRTALPQVMGSEDPQAVAMALWKNTAWLH